MNVFLQYKANNGIFFSFSYNKLTNDNDIIFLQELLSSIREQHASILPNPKGTKILTHPSSKYHWKYKPQMQCIYETACSNKSSSIPSTCDGKLSFKEPLFNFLLIFNSSTWTWTSIPRFPCSSSSLKSLNVVYIVVIFIFKIDFNLMRWRQQLFPVATYIYYTYILDYQNN